MDRLPRALRLVTLLDTAVASTNLGDRIVMEAVRAELAEPLRDAFVYSVASHEWMGRKSRSLVRRADFAIAGGTSLLGSHMWRRPVWKLSPLDALGGLEITLMGVGWYHTRRRPDLYTRLLLRRVLSRWRLHSVRDARTQALLASLGVPNAINTGCPTLWSLTPEHCARIPREKAERVVTALNTYLPRPDLDRRLLATLRRHYREVWFWTQTGSDREYARRLDPDLIHLEPRLEALDGLLGGEVDYVGNRLHAGIRALQKGRRAVIVEVDGRAREMGADFGLPTVERDAFERLARMIEGKLETRIELPREAIVRWKAQLGTPA